LYDNIVVKGGIMEKVRIVIGSPVRGGELWDRERELNKIWEVLETGSVLLTAPRRFGKTSLMLKLVDDPRDGWQAFYLDVEGYGRPEDFIAEIATTLLRERRFARLKSNVQHILGRIIDRIGELGYGELKITLREQLAPNWREKGQELIGLLKGLNTKTILIVDELPLFLNQMAKQNDGLAREFLSWLRSLRQTPDLHDQIRWVIGGSIGIEKVLRRIGAGTKEINDLERIHVREFSEDEAREFIKALLRSAGVQRIPKKTLDKFLQVIGIPIPFFIQILVRETINEMERQNKRTISEEMIERAYEEGVLAAYNRTYFEHYYERLREYYTPESANVAKALLTEIAHRDSITRKELWDLFQAQMQGQGSEDDFSSLLSDLENDFYITFNQDRQNFRFATKVLRDWWLRYHSLGGRI
jgi:hypothetical protein